MKRRIMIGLCAASALTFLLLASCGGEKQTAKQEARPASAEKAPEAKETQKPKNDPSDERALVADMLGVDLAKVVKDPSGLQYIVRREGNGEIPKKGERISAHYTGYLLNGQKFDSSVDRGRPFETPIGVGRVIPGWDIAFSAMKVGEKRVLFIPSALGYGERGAGDIIPPNATLVFDVELLGIVKAAE
jgi:peptidylprolyl isomerase